MALVGTLSTMPLSDLLQWLGSAGKSGTLHVERNKVSKRIVFRDGRVIACSTDEPKELLGHFLVSRGKIDEDTLRRALARQEQTGEHLGAILVTMGAISSKELVRHLAAKAEETIFGLFDWEEAVFRFHDGELHEVNIFPIDLRVEDILLQGIRRLDETRRFRKVFNDPGIVLRRADRKPPGQLTRNRMARRIYESINGGRTVAEILLHAHASEYLVSKFLFELFRSGLVEISEVRSVPSEPGAAPRHHRPKTREAGPSRSPAAGAGEEYPAAAAPETLVAAEPVGAAATAAVAAAEPADAPVPETTLEDDLAVAGNLMSRGEHDAALEILNTAYGIHQGDDALRRLLTEAEAAFVEKAYRHDLPPSKIPVLLSDPNELTAEQISPAEFFLLSRMDGVWDIKSIIQVSPIREVDALRTIKRMREKGIIELRDPE